MIALRQAYAKTIDTIMVFALIITCVGAVVACGMRWLNLKVIVAEREREREREKRSLDSEAGTDCKGDIQLDQAAEVSVGPIGRG